MSTQEYDRQIGLLEEEFERRKKELMKEFSFSNNPHKIGDIITDNIGSIKIEKIKWGKLIYKYPCCVYYGVELKKDLTPTKKQNNTQIWQSNLIKQ